VLFNNTNSTEQVGKSALFLGFDEPISFSNHFTRLRPSPELDAAYLTYWLVGQWQTGVFARLCDRWVGQSAIRADKLLSLTLSVPSVNDQRSIAAQLVDQLAAVGRTLDASVACRDLVRALASGVVDDELGSEARHEWLYATIGDLCEFVTDGTHQPPPFAAGGVPFLFVRNIVRGFIDFNVDKYVAEPTYQELTKRYRPRRGDVLYSAVGSFGVALVVDTDRPFTFQRHIALLRPRPDAVLPEFLVLFLNSRVGRAQSEVWAMGGAQRTVTLGALSNFVVPLPPVDQQLRIVAKLRARLKTISSMEMAVEAELEAIEALPGALLRGAFKEIAA
jgi:restriction endonuclease S subunit